MIAREHETISMEEFRDSGTFKRFWSRAEPASIDPQACRLWLGQKTRQRYGSVDTRHRGRRVVFTAHRVAYFLATGVDPVGAYVMHRCDNKSCVNPNHLDLGSHDDNMRDASVRGRHRHKLTADQVRAIRTLWATGQYTQRELAATFGVWQFSIRSILAGLTWKHVV